MSCTGKRGGRVRVSQRSCFRFEERNVMGPSVCCHLRCAPHTLLHPTEADAAPDPVGKG